VNRIDQIRAVLEQSLQPLSLEIEDESHLHAGHAGAASGRGHFNVRIVAQVFAGQTLVARHRQIYAALDDLMKTDIHALSIRALTPDEITAREAG
jgi:BolA protein